MTIRICAFLIMSFIIQSAAFAEKAGVFYDNTVEQMKFAATDVQTALTAKGYTVEMLPLSSLNTSYANKKVVIALASNTVVNGILMKQGGTTDLGGAGIPSCSDVSN